MQGITQPPPCLFIQVLLMACTLHHPSVSDCTMCMLLRLNALATQVAICRVHDAVIDCSPKPLLKLCDFGYSKSGADSLPKSNVGTLGYIGASTSVLFSSCAAC